ncbi:MAG: hypothetical protein R3301_02485 [Saprospiraceae bacterium]|nr:hypothetical protein [Saprospiraceae bacterium]
MKSSSKSIYSFFRLLVVTMLLWSACQQSAPDQNSEEPAQRIVLNSLDETKVFVQNDLAQPIPDDYAIPSYISSGLPVTQVYDSLQQRYPQFYGLEGESYLQAIMAAPEQYLRMSLENKAIRRYYDPNSRY